MILATDEEVWKEDEAERGAVARRDGPATALERPRKSIVVSDDGKGSRIEWRTSGGRLAWQMILL